MALLILLGAGTGEAAGKHILMLHSVERGSLVLDSFTGNFRVDLQSRAKETVTFTQFVVTPPGFGVSLDQPIVEFFRTAYAGRSRPDLVVTVGGSAAAFLRKNRQLLFPDSPVLYAAVDERWLRNPLSDTETATAVSADYPAIVEDMLRLFPRTTSVFMVTGAGEVGQFWRRELEREFQRFRNRVTFFWSDQMTYQQILRRVSMLPMNSAIFHLTLGTDAEGGAYPEERVLHDLRAAANAPLFAGLTSFIGHGIVGGHLLPTEQLHRPAVDVALRILDGEQPGRIRTAVQRAGRAIFDDRELQRWGVSRRVLPLDSEIRFREAGVWARFKWVIVPAGSALAAQTMLIALLLLHRRKRLRAEHSLRESENRFRLLANSAPVMIRISSTDMQCTDANHQWLTFTGRSLDRERNRGWFTGVHPEDRSVYIQTCVYALDRAQPFRAEYRLRRADGDYRWILESSAPRLRAGAVIGYIASAIDVSELKSARLALSNLSGRLMEAQEQERTRLARELHDDVGQRLSSLVMEAAQLTERLPDASSRAAMEDMSERLITLAGDIQSISHRLHSSKLEYLGFAAAADSFCREMASHHQMRIDYSHEHVPAQLRGDLAVNLFRVMQEAVTNSIKHSGAQQCSVSVRGGDDDVTLEVVDFGRGFDMAAAMKGQGLGLISIQERLKLMNGQVVIESRPGAGTAVRARVPLRQPAVERRQREEEAQA